MRRIPVLTEDAADLLSYLQAALVNSTKNRPAHALQGEVVRVAILRWEHSVALGKPLSVESRSERVCRGTLAQERDRGALPWTCERLQLAG